MHHKAKGVGERSLQIAMYSHFGSLWGEKQDRNMESTVNKLSGNISYTMESHHMCI